MPREIYKIKGRRPRTPGPDTPQGRRLADEGAANRNPRSIVRCVAFIAGSCGPPTLRLVTFFRDGGRTISRVVDDRLGGSPGPPRPETVNRFVCVKKGWFRRGQPKKRAGATAKRVADQRGDNRDRGTILEDDTEGGGAARVFCSETCTMLEETTGGRRATAGSICLSSPFGRTFGRL